MRTWLAIRCLLVASAASPLLAQSDAAKVPANGSAHADEVRHVAFDSSGKWLVSMDESVVKTWRLPEGKRVALAVVEGGASVIKISPTDPLVAILRKDYAVELRTLPELKLVRSWKTNQFTDCLAFSHDGSTVATCASGGVRFWGTATGTQVRQIELEEIFNNLAFSPDGKWLATSGRRDFFSGNPRLSLWQLDDLTRVRTMGSHSDGAYYTLSFTPDSNYLVAGSNKDQWSLWRVPSGQPVAIKDGLPYGYWTVTAGTDGATLLSADGGRVQVWNLPGGTQRLAFEGHQGQIYSIAPSPDGTTLATAGMDRAIRVWTLADGSLVQQLVDRTSAAKTTTTEAKGAAAAAGTKPAASTATGPPTGLVVSGRLVSSSGKPVAQFALRLLLAYPSEKGGLLYMFAPHYEATTDADGRFRFGGVKSGEHYALVDMSGGRPSPLKRADGSTVLLDFIKEPKSIALGEIRVE